MSVDETTAKCAICRKGHIDELAHGEWKTNGEYMVHYFCLLLSKDLPQAGRRDKDGILGFLPKDIGYTKLRTRTKCIFCKGVYASVHCSVKKCNRWWHVACGYEGKCLHTFENPFKSICVKHIQIKEQYGIHGGHWSCQICNELMGNYHPITSITSCCNQGYFHRTCIQKMANTDGSDTKCPGCGLHGEEYRHFLSQRGIFCPEKDSDRYEVESTSPDKMECKADQCICPMGRSHTRIRGEWRLKSCRFCGGYGIHVGCCDEDVFECEACTIISQSQPPPEPFVNPYVGNESDASDNTDGEEEDETNDNDNQELDQIGNESDIYSDESEDYELQFDGVMMVETKMAQFRTHSLITVKPDEVITGSLTHDDPYSDEEKLKMKKERLKIFFKRADFSVKPDPLPWLL